MIRSVDGLVPEIASSAYVDDRATVIGDVSIGENASLWPGVVARGDAGRIEIGEGVNLQDNAICHEDAVIDPYVTVGHAAIVHAAHVEERCIVGMNSVVLDNAEIGHHSIVAAGSVVTENTKVEPYSLVVGTPAKVKGDTSGSDWFEAAERYMERAEIHAETSNELTRADVLPD